MVPRSESRTAVPPGSRAEANQRDVVELGMTLGEGLKVLNDRLSGGFRPAFGLA
jgi:hypothetical protein